MRRREFLGKMVGTSLAALSLDAISKAGDTGFEERARKYLRSIKPSRQRIEDFITGEYGPRDKRPGEVFQYDSELGWVHHEAVGSTGVDRSKVFYSYEPDGARKVLNSDGAVDFLDFVMVASHFGERITPFAHPNPDVNGDGEVDILDLVMIGTHFGEEYDEAKR